jgi:hypothetical protein
MDQINKIKNKNPTLLRAGPDHHCGPRRARPHTRPHGLATWLGPPKPRAAHELAQRSQDRGDPAPTDGARPSYTQGAGEELRRGIPRRRRLLRWNQARLRTLHVTPHLDLPSPQPLLHRGVVADGDGGHRCWADGGDRRKDSRTATKGGYTFDVM